MCASLMSPQKASTDDLKEAVERKMRKFNGLLNMPLETRKMVEAALKELDARSI